MTDKNDRARRTFKALRAACPAFAGDIAGWDTDHEDRHADVNCKMTDGSRLDFQLVEWLEADQMAESVNRDRAEKEIVKGLLERYPQPPDPLRSAVLKPKPAIRRPSPGDLAEIIDEFGSLINAKSRDYPVWVGRQGYRCCNLTRWSTLQSYFCEVDFNHYSPAPGWIMFSMRGGAYNPADAFGALGDAVERKLTHYGASDPAIPLDLLVHYSRAATCNTPFLSLDISDFEGVAKALAGELPCLIASLGRCPFRQIFLLDERQPGSEAFLVYPGFQRCG